MQMSSRIGKTFVFSSLAVGAGVMMMPHDAHGATLAGWTFETSAPVTAGPISPETGSGSGTGVSVGATTNTYSSPAGNGSAKSWSSNGWDVGDYFQFSTAGDGNTTYSIGFDQVGSNTGPRDFKVQYSTNGTTFTDLSNYTVLANVSPNAWSSATPVSGTSYSFNVDVGSAPANIYFRLVDTSTTSTNGSTVASGGTGRVDNIVIASGVVPEPASLGLLAAGGLLSIRRRRA